MRILLVNYEWPGVAENCGGGGAVSKALHDGLERRGHDVRAITDEADGHYSTFPARYYRDLRRGVEWADVVNGHFSIPSSLPLPRLCRRSNTPLAVSVMGADVYDPTRYQWIRPALDLANRYVLGAADAVVAPSRDMADRTERQCGVSPTIIPYGIDADAWEWRRRNTPNTPTILTVCRLVERKNLTVARDAISQLSPPVDWRVVGTGPLAEEVGSWPEATALGYVNDLQAEFDAADVFFLPSKHEAFGIVFIEALACGLPIVTSSCGGQVDILDHGSVGLKRQATPPLQASALRSVLQDYDRYQAATEGYVAEYFDRETMVSEYECLYHELYE